MHMWESYGMHSPFPSLCMGPRGRYCISPCETGLYAAAAGIYISSTSTCISHQAVADANFEWGSLDAVSFSNLCGDAKRWFTGTQT